MMRWWWFGPDVTRTELNRELEVMAAAGIGGVEVSYVYPLSSDSPELLSSVFLDNLRYAAERARELGLRFDLTLGSGWSFGGPHIGPEDAAKKLEWERREINGDAAELPIRVWPGDRLIAAFIGGGSAQEPPTDCELLATTDGVLRVPAGSGPRQLLLAIQRPTGQIVKRAAAGADGPVLDHYSAQAARAHLESVAEPLLAAVGSDLVESVFCDSLEVYGANWTPELITEFETRRGYPLIPRLYELIINTPGSGQLRADYYRTLTDLYEQNFVSVFQRWSAEHGVKFRIQGYGTPPAKISSYRFADLYEGEGWGWKTLTQTRWASSAAHLDNLPVVSAESWTWTHSPTFRATPLDLKGEAHELILDGVNHFIGHGWPYSPSGADRDGLGWFFYAAGALDDRNPWWPAMPGLAGYLQRLSWLQRQGTPVADVLLYVPSDDLYRHLGSEVGGSIDLWREANRAIDPGLIATIREGGWDYDLIDDDLIGADGTLDPATRPVMILPAVDQLPDTTRERIASYQRDGGTVLAVGGSADLGIPTRAEGLGAALQRAVRPDLLVTPQNGDLGFVHRRWEDCEVYLVINTGVEETEFIATPRAARRGYEVWDPATATVIANGSGGSAPINLAPYQAAVLVCHDHTPAAATPYVTQTGRIELIEGWTAAFPSAEGEPEPMEIDLPHRWEDERNVSGTVVYRTTTQLTEDWLTTETPTVIDFGDFIPVAAANENREGIRGRSYRVHGSAPVREVVEVIVNGQPAGVVWAPPYRLEVGQHLVPGSNRIELRVSNTAANALAEDAAIGLAVETSRRQYGQRFSMQDLDRALDGVESGLLSVPALVRYTS
jgi:hypothetical protein